MNQLYVFFIESNKLVFKQKGSFDAKLCIK